LITAGGWLGPSKRFAEKLWYARSRHRLLDIPIPCRLPYGGWFLAHGDAIGARVAGYRFSRSPYEEPQWRLVARCLPPGGTFVDVGANQGFYTILASRRVGASGIVYAFEPAPTEARKLRANLRINRCRNVIVEQAALGATSGKAEFFMYLRHQGSWSGLRKAAEDVDVAARVIEVAITSLDEYFAEPPLERLDIMKIDVEGGELNVLRGAARTIQSMRPIILCEVESRRTGQWGYDASAIITELEAMDYRWCSVARDGRLHGPATLTDGWQNLAAIPAEKLGELAVAKADD
jgi:FkbM family methyltransferase